MAHSLGRVLEQLYKSVSSNTRAVLEQWRQAREKEGAYASQGRPLCEWTETLLLPLSPMFALQLLLQATFH